MSPPTRRLAPRLTLHPNPFLYRIASLIPAPRIWSNLIFCQYLENKGSVQDHVVPLLVDKQLNHYPGIFKISKQVRRI